MRFVFSPKNEWHQEQTSNSCSIVLQHSLHDAFHQMEWYAKAGRQTKPSSYQRSHNRLDGGRYANREQTQATRTYAPTEMRIDRQKWDTVCIQFTFQSSSAKQINKGVLSVATLCRGSKRIGKREREKIVVKTLRTGAGAKRLYPLPSPPPKSAYVVTNDTFIFLQRLCICKTAEVHQDVKYFGWPPRLLWKITRWKYNYSAEDVESLSLCPVFCRPVQ